MLAALNRRKTPVIVISANHCAIEVKLHARLAGDGGQMKPLVRPKNIRDLDHS